MPGKMKLFFSTRQKIEYGGFHLSEQRIQSLTLIHQGCRLSISCPPSLPWVAKETQALSKAAVSSQLLQRRRGPVLAEECVHSLTCVHNFNRCYCSSSVSIQVWTDLNICNLLPWQTLRNVTKKGFPIQLGNSSKIRNTRTWSTSSLPFMSSL